MAGGLIELVNYGVQDLYLTGTPQITFFKSIYRRHTNFSIETMKQHFKEDKIDFGKKLTCFVEKNGDLVYKTNLVLDIPEVHLQIFDIADENDITAEEDLAYDTATNELQIADDFMNFNIELYRQALTKLQPKNVTSISAANIFIAPLIATLDPSGNIRNNFKLLLEQYGGTTASIQVYNKIYVVEVLSTIELFILSLTDISKINIITLFKAVEINSTKIHKEFYYRKQLALRDKLSANNFASDGNLSRYAKFAWTKRLGHAAIDYVEVQIGGSVIDKQYGDWINVWWELSHNVFHTENYNKLIGDIPELTTFDTNLKPNYLVKIPLQFWFCKFLGLALPLISLNFYDVIINVKLQDIDKCCYTDDLGVDLINTVSLNNAYLEIEYIYLDVDERKRFAQVTHEYLIEQVQYIEFIAFNQKEHNFKITFVNPCKELIYVFQRDDFVENFEGTNETQFYNYTLNKIPPPKPITIDDIIPPQYSVLNSISGESQTSTNFNYTNPYVSPFPFQTGNPILESSLFINGYRLGEIMSSLDSNYLNPFKNSNTPADGINIYSFGFEPEIHQPTGTCNLGVISSTDLNIKFLEDVVINNIQGKFRIYGLSYNILRFFSGLAGLAFTSGTV
jgi:hypothetical protein